MVRIIFLILLTSNIAFAQQWFTYPMSGGIEVDFPAEPLVIDTTSHFTMAVLDTAGARFMASEEPFSNYKYSKKITNNEDLIEFYRQLDQLMLKSYPDGATQILSTFDYKNDLLVHWAEYTVEGDIPNLCGARIILTDGKVYFVRGCSSDSATYEMQRRFLISLNVTSEHFVPSQFNGAPPSAPERAGMAIGNIILFLIPLVLIGWLTLYIILVVKTRSSEAPKFLQIMFSIFRWASVGIFGFGSLGICVYVFTSPQAQDRPLTVGIGIAFVLIALAIGFIRKPAYRPATIVSNTLDDINI